MKWNDPHITQSRSNSSRSSRGPSYTKFNIQDSKSNGHSNLLNLLTGKNLKDKNIVNREANHSFRNDLKSQKSISQRGSKDKKTSVLKKPTQKSYPETFILPPSFNIYPQLSEVLQLLIADIQVALIRYNQSLSMLSVAASTVVELNKIMRQKIKGLLDEQTGNAAPSQGNSTGRDGGVRSEVIPRSKIIQFKLNKVNQRNRFNRGHRKDSADCSSQASFSRIAEINNQLHRIIQPNQKITSQRPSRLDRPPPRNQPVSSEDFQQKERGSRRSASKSQLRVKEVFYNLTKVIHGVSGQ